MKPDFEFICCETGHVYYQGKIYGLHRRMIDGNSAWALTRKGSKGTDEDAFIGADIDDISRWLVAQHLLTNLD